jgi:hypothetical protein
VYLHYLLCNHRAQKHAAGLAQLLSSAEQYLNQLRLRRALIEAEESKNQKL